MSRSTLTPTPLMARLIAVVLGLAAVVSIFTDTWFYLLLGVGGVLFVVIALVYPRQALLIWLLVAPLANRYASISLPSGLPDITFGRVTIGVVGLALLLQVRLKGRRLAPTGGVELAMVALLAIMVLDLGMRSTNLTSDVLQTFDERITPVLLFLAARNLFGQPGDVKTVARILAIVGCYLALHGGYQFVTATGAPAPDADPADVTRSEGGDRVNESHLEEGRAVGPFGNAVEYGSVTAIAFVATLFLALSTDGIRRLWPIAALAPIGVAIILCSTRSPWVGAYFGVVAMALLDRKRRVALLLLLTTATVTVLTVLMLLPEDSSLKERSSSLEPIYGRLVMYRVAATLAVHNPILGYGRGAPSRVAARKEIYKLGGAAAEWAPGQFHNIYLMTVVEWGIGGLIAYLAIHALFLRGAFELRRRLPDQKAPEYHFASFFIATSVVYLIQGMFVDTPPFLYLNGVYFFLAGLIHAHLDALPVPAPAERQWSPVPVRALFPDRPPRG
jgi:O-antigen ligase